MYKVLIVDDEALVRIGLKTTINWNEIGFSIAADATNGEQAYQLYKKYKPEVIITDIRMPKKDGFYLIEKIRKENKKAKILVLTVYDEFSYVRKALKLGADDYILKTEIEDEELVELMLNIKKDLEKESSDTKSVINEENELSIKKSLFTKIIRNDFELNPKLKEKFKQLDFKLADSSFLLTNILIEEVEEKNNELKKISSQKINDALINIAIDQFSDKNINYIYHHDQDNYIFLLSASDLDSKKIKTLLKTIHKAAKQYFDIDLKIIYSSIFNNIDELYSNYKKIIEKNEIIFYQKKNEIFVKQIDEIKFEKTNIFELKQKYNRVLVEAVSAKNMELINNKIDEINNYFNQNNINPMEVKLFYSNLLTDIFNSFKTFLNSEEDLEDYEQYYYSILNESYLIKIKYLFYEFIKVVIENIKNSNHNYSNILVDRALNYIESNYDRKISLENIAEELSISKNYLCNVFKEETGENTAAYINKLRIEKAKQLLLERNYKLKEIYSKVGFSNQYYFSKVFKKISGMTVTEYKDLINDS